MDLIALGWFLGIIFWAGVAVSLRAYRVPKNPKLTTEVIVSIAAMLIALMGLLATISP